MVNSYLINRLHAELAIQVHVRHWTRAFLPGRVRETTVFLHDAKNHKYWTAVRHYARYRSTTNNKLPFFQKLLVFFDGKQSIEPCPIVLVWRSSVPHRHKQFSRTRSAVTEYKGHLQLKPSTTERDHASVSYVHFKGRKTHSRRYDNDIDTEHKIEVNIHTVLNMNTEI